MARRWMILVLAAAFLLGCGGSKNSDNPATGDQWDQMHWDQGRWG